MSLSREEIVQNIIEVCGRSETKAGILKSVRKKANYRKVASLLGKDETYCSSALNEMLVHGLVQNEGQRGQFRQTPIVRTLNIDSILLHQPQMQKRRPLSSLTTKTIVRRVPSFDEALGSLDVDRVLQRDCFPLKKPYRKDVGEAYLTLENVIKQELNLPDTIYGIDSISEANRRGLFERPVPAEKQGMVQLFNAAVLWLRNPSHHRKKDIPRNDAFKMILFADYLIKLVRKQKKLNKL